MLNEGDMGALIRLELFGVRFMLDKSSFIILEFLSFCSLGGELNIASSSADELSPPLNKGTGIDP